MSFLWITLNVTDLDKTIEFYEGIAGLKLSKRFKTRTRYRNSIFK